MQVFEVGQERYAAITAVEVTVLYVGCLVDVEVAQWIELGGLLGILLGEPYFIRAEDVLVKQSRFVVHGDGSRDPLFALLIVP